MSWRERLTPAQLEEIDKRADSYGAAARHSRDDAPMAGQRAELVRLEKLAGKLWHALVEIDVRSEDALEVAAYGRLEHTGMDLAQRTAELVRELRIASGIAAAEMAPRTGKPVDRWKHELAHEVKQILRGADLTVTGYSESDAAEAIRYAFEHAGMYAGDVRKYL